MYEMIANNYILYIQKCQLTPKYNVAIKVLNEFINFLRDLPNKKPSKEEIKITIDVIKEIEKSFAQTEEVKQQIDNSCEFAKAFVDWGYKE